MKTFVFTDIVRSVTLKGQMAGRSDAERDEAYVTQILTPHRKLIEDGLERSGGRVVSTAGDGHFLVFTNTITAAQWAITVLQAHRDQPILSAAGDAVQVRVSLHVGFPQKDPGDPDNFVGRVVDYAARLNDYATGGQLLISTAALGLLKDAGLERVSFHSHGQHELRGIGDVEIWELLYDGNPPSDLRDSPKRPDRREWTVLPATMGLTEYVLRGASSGATASLAPPTGAPEQSRLGNYQLEQLLGAGGMGNVYKARHVQFDRDRAIKVIKPQFLEAGNQNVINRFYREIKAVGALEHPNIVVAIDSSAPSDATHYLVMEYVRGLSADELVRKAGPLDLGAACEIIRQAALGLEYIDQQGMVHRDIKPSNLMITQPEATQTSNTPPTQPLVKILDLGLALLTSDDQSRLTQMDHGAMGTAMYMSPEQWKTTSVDIRSDIYSLGCSLYHLLVGSPPFFDSDLKPEKAHERLGAPSLRSRREAPKPLDAVLQRMLAKRPADRYQSPGEVAEALAPYSDAEALAKLMARHQAGGPQAHTTPDADDDTRQASSRAGETHVARRRIHQPDAAYGSHGGAAWRRWLAPLLAAAALVAVAMLSWGLITARDVLQATRKGKLENLAVLAAPQLAEEITARFRILQQAAESETLREALVALEEKPEGSPDDWTRLQEWIQTESLRHQEDYFANSWFVTDRTGTQVARSPKSDSIGETYWRRDYFHGLGKNLPETAERPAPITGPHLSAVYRSDSTGRLKIAFSMPISNGARRPEDRRELGVLGMSIELGEFRLLKDSKLLTKPLELVLVDLRAGRIEGVSEVGLLLHHPDLDRYKRAFRLPEPALEAVMEKIRADDLAGERLIEGYQDVLGRETGPYWGGFFPVSVPSQNQRDAKWLVIIQEPMS